VNGPVSKTSLFDTVTGLSAGARYEYQVCGNAQLGQQFICVGPDDANSTTTKFATPASVHVFLYGDSLASEAGPYFAYFGSASGKAAIVTEDYGGTAVCDWLSKMKSDATTYHPQAVALQFSGNASTPCMAGYEPETPEYYLKYISDTTTAINIFRAIGAKVYLVGYPISYSASTGTDPNWDQLNLDYQTIANQNPGVVEWVDAGTSVEGADGTFTWTLPCLSWEPCVGTQLGYPAGTNVVRAPDGVHFCPDGKPGLNGVVGSCDVYMSGDLRYGAAMIGPIAQDFSF
jgi:hypothetical protein